jgi:hypothetical protein
LLLLVMRRAGVGPWLATAVASSFVLFGNGQQNIAWGFQVGFVGSVAFGLIQLVLSDHDGAWNRRDWGALAAGLAALMCSGVGVAMVVGVGTAVLVRRGVRAAFLHVAPLALIYVAWFLVIGHEGHTTSGGGPSAAARFVADTYGATLHALGQSAALGALLATMLVVGLPLAWKTRQSAAHRATLAAPFGLAVASLAFLAVTGVGRGQFPGFYEQTRYHHITAALLLPAIAVGADAFARRWKWLLPIAMATFVIGIPGNMEFLARFERTQKTAQADFRQMMLAYPRTPLARTLPRDMAPDSKRAFTLTIGWLRDGVASGRIPPPPTFTPAAMRTAQTELIAANFRWVVARCLHDPRCNKSRP